MKSSPSYVAGSSDILNVPAVRFRCHRHRRLAMLASEQPVRLLARRLPSQSSDFYILTQVVTSCQSINFFQRLSFALFLAPFLRRLASLPQLVRRVNQLLFTSFTSTVTLLPRLQQLNFIALN